MAYNPISVANAFIEKASKEKCRDLTLLKLMKLVYFAHAWHIVLSNGDPLVDEEFEAWTFGPVSRDIYDTFKKYRLQPITNQELPEIVNLETLDSFRPYAPPPSDESFYSLLDQVWSIYGSESAEQLSHLTHQPEDPWYEIWENQGGKNVRGAGIPNSLIYSQYKAMLMPEKSETV